MSRLDKEAQALGLALSDAQSGALDQFQRLLLEWNARFNLTAITDPAEIEVRHFLDSFSVVRALDPAGASQARAVIDIGSGAGLPGIPLAIAFPAWRILLLEATRKKVTFLETAIAALGLPNATALQARAEDAARLPAHREKYDLALGRAVAALPVLAEYMLPFVRVGGQAIAYKGIAPEAELNEAEPALQALGGRLSRVVPVQLPGLDVRHLVVIAKEKRTPAAYPRRAGLPQSKPLAAR